MPSVVQQLCDVHYAAGEIEPGEVVVVKIGALERVLILCETDRKQFVTPLLDLMNEHGAKPQPRVAQPSTQLSAFGTQPLPDGVSASDALAVINDGRCFWPGCDFVSTSESDKRSRAAAHLKAHGVTLTALGLGRRGVNVAERHVVGDDVHACTASGCDRTFPTAQSRGMHEFRAHGIRNKTAKKTTARKRS